MIRPTILFSSTLRRLDETLDRLVEEVRDVNRRVTSLEFKLALLHNDFAGLTERIGRIDTRLERTEPRLATVGADQ